MIENFLYLSAVVLFFAATFGWVNSRWFHWPSSIAMMLPGVAISLGLLGLEHISGGSVIPMLHRTVSQIQFGSTLLIGLLSFLLFAGALQVDLGRLKKQAGPVLILATVGVVISTVLIGNAAFYLLAWLGLPVALPWCMVFGSLISPTDPVAVVNILRRMNLSPHIQTQISGESLLNDGVVITLFSVLVHVAQAGSGSLSGLDAFIYFLREVVGGVVPGFCCGYLAYLALSRIDDYFTEIIITLAVVTGLYSLALVIDASGPLAVVTAGLVIGNRAMQKGMSERTRNNLRLFWEVLEHILNSALFVMIGFELLALDFRFIILPILLLMIPLVLIARLVSVASAFLILSHAHFPKGTIRTLTWGGLRGGISIALALALPDFPGRAALIVLAYGIVVISLILQGLTLERLASRWMSPSG